MSIRLGEYNITNNAIETEDTEIPFNCQSEYNPSVETQCLTFGHKT